MDSSREQRGRRWVHMRDVLRALVSRDFKLRYKRSFLGIAWSLMVPLAQLVVMYIVFQEVIPIQIPHFTVFLFTGILPWTWFQTSLLSASGTFVDSRELVKQVGFPVAVLPTISVFSQLIHFMLALPILAAFLIADGSHFTIALVALPLVIAIQFLLTVSLAYVFATIQVTFRDIQHLLGIVLFLMFYLTPIFYEVSNVPAKYKIIYQLNPMVPLLNAYRSIFIAGQFPDPQPLLILTAISAGILSAGYLVFHSARERFVEEL
jgi:lipopolysaccharide transport system permease protein